MNNNYEKEYKFLSDKTNLHRELYHCKRQVEIYLEYLTTTQQQQQHNANQKEQWIKFIIYQEQEEDCKEIIVKPFKKNTEPIYYIYCGRGYGEKSKNFCKLILDKLSSFMFYFEFIEPLLPMIGIDRQVFKNHSVYLTTTKTNDECFLFLPDFFEQTNGTIQLNQKLYIHMENSLYALTCKINEGEKNCFFEIQKGKSERFTLPTQQQQQFQLFYDLINDLEYNPLKKIFQLKKYANVDTRNFLFKLDYDKKHCITLRQEILIISYEKQLYQFCIGEIQL